MVRIKYKLLDKTMPVPSYAHKGDAGLDLLSAEDCVIAPYERRLVHTGLMLEIPEGYAGFVQPRSGLAIKHGISLVNTPGLIDSGYRGEICIIMINLDKKQDFLIKKYDKICQIVFKKIEEAELVQSEILEETERGTGGFGSTGK